MISQPNYITIILPEDFNPNPVSFILPWAYLHITI